MLKFWTRSSALILGLMMIAVAHAIDLLNESIALEAGEWRHFPVQIESHYSEFNLNAAIKGDARVFVRFGAPADGRNFDAELGGGLASLIGRMSTGSRSLRLSDETSPALRNGVLYVSVSSGRPSLVSLKANARVAASSRTGMGAVPYEIGTMFRVWAPFADSVHVAGQFNGWSSTLTPLQPNGNGHWSIDVRGAVPGQQYKFVIRNGNQTLWRNDPRARALTNSVGNSIIYDPEGFEWSNPSYQTPNWNEMVIYQLHIGSFNAAPGGPVGTFNSAIARLDDLQALGINAIKLLPVHEFAGDFSWGYNPSHPFSVESAYGGPDELKRFVDECHKRGIAVLLDLVHNHYGPSDLDMWRFDGWYENGRGGIYFYNDLRANTPWGDTRPDFGRPEVRQYIRDNALMWLQEYRIDGIRWDSTLNIRQTIFGDNLDGWSLMQWINDEINATQPWKIQIAEDLQGNEWITRPTSGGGAGFDSQWTGSFHSPLRPLMITPWDGDRNMWDLVGALNQRYNGNPWQRVIYTESHDEVANGKSRVPQEIDPGNPGSYWARKRSTLGAVATMTAPGIPMIFMGQEFLEDGWFRDDVPLDWSKAQTYGGIRLMYRDLIQLRRNWFNSTRGLSGPHINVFHVNNSAKVVAYHRWQNGGVGDDVVILMNWSNQSFENYQIGLPAGGQWRVIFNSDWNGYSPDFDNTFTADVIASNTPRDGLNFSGGFRLGRYSAVILVRE